MIRRPPRSTPFLHDALPISGTFPNLDIHGSADVYPLSQTLALPLSLTCRPRPIFQSYRSEEHTSELQSHSDLVCRLLLEKKKKIKTNKTHIKYYTNPMTSKL